MNNASEKSKWKRLGFIFVAFGEYTHPIYLFSYCYYCYCDTFVDQRKSKFVVFSSSHYSMIAFIFSGGKRYLNLIGWLTGNNKFSWPIFTHTHTDTSMHNKIESVFYSSASAEYTEFVKLIATFCIHFKLVHSQIYIERNY